MMPDKFIVELEPGVWLAEWRGDPGRTLDKRFAKEFDSYEDALLGRSAAMRMRPFKQALIKVKPAEGA